MLVKDDNLNLLDQETIFVMYFWLTAFEKVIFLRGFENRLADFFGAFIKWFFLSLTIMIFIRYK